MRPRNITEAEFATMLKNHGLVYEPVRARPALKPRHDGTSGGEHRAVPDVATRPEYRQRDKPSSSPYKSKWEAAYAAKLELEKRAGIIKDWWYEPFSLWLTGKVRFKPDFLVHYHPTTLLDIGSGLEVVEVKGWSKNRRDGITRLKMAAALFPCFVWRMVYRTKQGGWDGNYV